MKEITQKLTELCEAVKTCPMQELDPAWLERVRKYIVALETDVERHRNTLKDIGDLLSQREGSHVMVNIYFEGSLRAPFHLQAPTETSEERLEEAVTELIREFFEHMLDRKVERVAKEEG